MKINEALKLVRETISDPKNWCQGDAFQDYKGNSVGPDKAEKYCLLGSMAKNLPDKQDYNAVWHYLHSVVCQLAWFNDTHSHSEVLDLLDKAILSFCDPEEIMSEELEANKIY